MRSSVLFCFLLVLGMWAVNCQVVEQEDKDGGSGDMPTVNGIGTDDEDATTESETSGDSIDIDDTTVPSTTTDVQSEEPTTEDQPTTEEPTTMDTPTTMETPPTTTDEEMTVGSGGTEEPTDDTEDTTATTEGSGTEEPTSPEKPTESEDKTTVDSTDKTATTVDPLPPKTDDNNAIEDMFGDDVSNAAARNAKEEDGEAAGLESLTSEVIAAVIIGAVCAIIIIAFLVYRLKKRDEGSYALDESTHYTNKDAYKFSAEGKEAFV